MLKKLKLCLLIGLCASSNDPKTIASSDNSISIVFPGRGYSSITQDVAEAVCFTPRSTSFGNFRSELHYESSFKQKEVREMLGINLNAQLSLEKYKGEAAIQYLESDTETEVSFSTHYLFRISRDVYLNYPFQVNASLTEDGKAIYSYGPDLFRTLCGDTYIKSYEDGAYLIYTFTFSFSHRDHKESFEAKAGVNNPLISVMAAYQKLFEELNIEGTITLKAKQVGGDPRKLSLILPQETITCMSSNLAACQRNVDDLYKYSQIFPMQVDLQQDPSLGTPIGPYMTNSMPFLTQQIDLRP